VAGLPARSRLLRLPSPVVEILFGVLLGKTALDLSLGGEWLPFLADLGFLVLMFAAGMEINFSMLGGMGRGRLAFQVSLFVGTVTLAALSVWAMGMSVFMALVLSTTSLGLVMPALRDVHAQGSPLGQTILLAATLADFCTLLGITFFVLWHQYGLSLRFVYPLPLFAGFALLLWAARRWAWWHPGVAERLLLTEDTQEQGVRLSLALLFLFVGMSELVHLEPVLGAFMGGAIISFVFREKEVLESKISAIGFGFLIPLFFIHVGMQFDLGNVVSGEGLVFVALLLAVSLGVKLVPCLFFPLVGMSAGDGVKAGFLLSSRLSLIVAAAAIGLQEGFISVEIKDAIVLLALLTCFIGPTVFKLLYGLGRRRSASS
jgi:Kef-type K+ transport system membrane component KefB